MKKNKPFGELFYRSLKKTLLTMRIAIILMILGILQARANDAYSQKTRLSINFSETELVKVLDKIEVESEFFFLYNEKLLDIDRKVNITKKDQLISAILDDLFAGTDVKYTIIDRKIILAPDYLTSEPQQKQITGTVTDKDGTPLAGVNVVVTGITVGALTDVAGKYSIEVPQGSKSLTFSFVGMVSQEITIGTLTQINVTMAESAIGLGEVVVIGYGTQRKENITGAVSNMNDGKIAGKTVTQASQVLSGEMSGISVRQASGNPGEDDVDIRIRGLGTFSSAGNNPLVVIDGIESSINNLNASDIKSISVLKDAASASIYGSKAANGVILVETKFGEAGKPRLKYSTYFGATKPTSFPDFVDSWTYAEALNEALVNMGSSRRWSDAEIQTFRDQSDPVNYPNATHLKDLFSSGAETQNKHDLSISGGTESAQYYFAMGYLNQEGLISKNFYDRYDLRLNVNSKITDKISLKTILSGNISEREEPYPLSTMITGGIRLNNTIPGRLPDGYYGHLETHHPEATLDAGSFDNTKANYLSSNVNLSWNILPTLQVSGLLGYTISNSQNKIFNAKYNVTPTYGYSPNTLTVKDVGRTSLTNQLLVNYDKQISKHLIHVLGGFSRQTFNYSLLQAYRDNLANNTLYELNAASPTNSSNGGTADRNKLESYFGRLNYSFDSKYLFEANVRYDGSSRFSSENRFGLFPSFSAGWNMSNEEFFKSVVPAFVNQVKLRGSWGVLGNQSIGSYPYQQLIALNENYAFGGVLYAGAAGNTVPNPDITWETTESTDFGIDIFLLDNKFNMSADYFIKTTSDILYNISASSTLGATPSIVNAGVVKNNGWDIDLGYKGVSGDFSYGISANLSIVHNEVVELANVEYDIANGLFIGEELGSIWGYETDGLFVDADDVANYPTQPYSAQPGTVRYRDISGPNGVPDNVVSAKYDRHVIGSSLPNYIYGMRLQASYKGFDMFALFAGEGGMQRMMGRYEFAFANNGNIQEWQWRDRWTTANPNPDATYPRLTTAEPYFETNSTFFMHNASFLRLKNIELGYTIPSTIIKKIGIESMRIYVNGQNLLTFSNFEEGWDPEMDISGTSIFYPPTSVIAAGISIDF